MPSTLLSRCALSLALAPLALAPLATRAEDSVAAAAAADPAFTQFFEHFREAVTLDDRESVKSMTRLPIFLDGESRDGDGFLAQFDWLFTSVEKSCFASETPVADVDGSYSLFCGDLIFVFQKTGDSYHFTDIGAND